MSALGFVDGLAERGVLGYLSRDNSVRFVTHPCLGSERCEVSVEGGIQQVEPLDALHADDLAELQAAQPGNHNIYPLTFAQRS
jgi:hypothetical protein